MILPAVTQEERAERFRRMHRGRAILVLPNAWDVASAMLIARQRGCRAVATTSSGVAWSRGYPDGERIPPEEMIDVVGRIARAVDVPVSADLEAGYGDAAATAKAAWAAGAVGLNLEDSREERELVPAEEHAASVRAVHEAVPGLVINARTDVYLAGLADFDETVARGNAYLAAGADCIFMPGVVDGETIGRLAKAIDGPISVLALAGTPPAAELERLGVARVSVGGGLARASLARVEEAAGELLRDGTFGFLENPLSNSALNAMLDRGGPQASPPTSA